MTAITPSKQEIPFDIYDSITISFLNVDTSKFNLVKTKDRQNNLIYVRCYENKPYVLIIDTPSDDTKGSSRFVSFGLKKSFEWDEKTRKFTDVWNGEYDLGIKLIQNIGNTESSVFNSATPVERKLIDVLDAIRDASIRDLVLFDEMDETTAETLVKPIYNRTVAKDEKGIPKKVKGKPVYDETKSPVWNIKCIHRFAPGVKFEKGKKVDPEDKVLTTKFYKPTPTEQLYRPDELLNTTVKGIYFIKFGNESQSKSGWGARSTIQSAVLTVIQKKQLNLGELQYATKYSFIDNEREEQNNDQYE
jgi:hypothetical protein